MSTQSQMKSRIKKTFYRLTQKLVVMSQAIGAVALLCFSLWFGFLFSMLAIGCSLFTGGLYYVAEKLKPVQSGDVIESSCVQA